MNQRVFIMKKNGQKVERVFQGKRFYVLIAVGLCILAVGAVYFTTNHLISAGE